MVRSQAPGPKGGIGKPGRQSWVAVCRQEHFRRNARIRTARGEGARATKISEGLGFSRVNSGPNLVGL